jgi:Flp pilus assembly protein CpaB
MATEELTFGPRGRNAGRLSLWLGLAAAAAAAVLIALILSGGAGNEKVVPATRLAVVANRDIPAQTPIRAEMLQVDTFELSEVDANAFTAVAQLERRVTATGIQAGQVILPSMVTTTASDGLPIIIPHGWRAVPIGVKDEVIIGNVTPGDRVDVIGVVEVPPNTLFAEIIDRLSEQAQPVSPAQVNRASVVTFTMLQNIKVLAVDQNLPNQPPPAATTTPGGATKPAPSESANPDAATVTLEVTPQHAQILAVADNKVTLRLSLRPLGDDSRPPVTPIITPLY